MTQEVMQLVNTYGYWLMAFGALIEGETFLLAGGIAASQGMLHVPGLIVLAIVGSVIHDNAFFALGRFGGRAILDRKPSWHDKAEATLKLFDRYGVWLIIALRFMYGFRTIIPTVIGMSPISYIKFIIFDIIGGFLWSSTFILGGFYFGKAIELAFKSLHHYEVWFGRVAIFAIIFAIIIAVFWVWFKKRRKR